MEHEERLKAALADRYSIEGEIGSGGMATVYRAQDLKHDRMVAVKVLNPELTQSLGAERFLREIKTAANLTHPHILPVHDSGEADGFLFFVMPFVKGESLRTRLTKERQLPVEDAIRIAREIADALDYAHREGVIHRDVKPANVMLEEGHAVLADFGVAHAVAEACDDRITRTGTSLGTPAYMSPEQATGEENLDGRSDEYALGCVLYEMLAGHPPFTGTQVETVVRKHLTEEPPSVTQSRPAVPEEVAKVINRSLAKSPADRFRTTGEMAAALPLTTASVQRKSKRLSNPVRVGLGIAVVVGITAVATLFYRSDGGPATESPALPQEGKPSITVLPCQNFSPNPADAFRAQGIHEEILLRLQGISSVRSIGRTSVLQFAVDPPPVNEIAAALGVGFVGECSVLKDPDQTQIRVTFQLLDASGAQVWAESYDRDLTVANIYDIQGDIAQRVAQSVGAVLTPADEAQISSIPTESLEAYDNYLRGRHYWHQRSLTAFDSAISYFSRAILLDPDYALAYAALAETYVLLPEYGGPPIPETLPLARAATGRALALDPDLAEAYTASGYLKSVFEWNWDTGERDFLKAIELNPDYATAHQWYGELLGKTRRWDEALVEAREAVELDPLSPAANLILAVLLTEAGRPDEAIPMQRRALGIVPDWITGIYESANTQVLLGDYAAAAPLFDRLALLTGSDPEAYRAYLAALADPERIPAAVMALDVSNIYSNISAADYLAHLGRFDEALTVLEQDYAALSPRLPWVNADPKYDGLRSDPRFQDLLRRMNLY